MASVIPVKEKKLMDVKLGELPSWILMRDFTPNGILGAFQREHELLRKYH
ncbi:ATP synthase subunit f, mitochondrial isoform X2 [Carlito syrichta]|uniref:ATP synthase F(0) complex subunit f, mitochondrial n=1 Tax=Carlito syrichta TaxID=1868482 RepID=A0A1U7UB42_CARSF|nr:ATP synthase subunit f, mitochondrial isoform X2 [Carlito syrichta]